MPQAGDSYIVPVTASQAEWGEYRNPTNRDPVEGEGYIAIPLEYARRYNIFNSNNTQTGLGFNEFIATSRDGFINGEILLAQGCVRAGDPYAKNFSVKKNLKRIGGWLAYNNVTTGNRIRVTFTSPTEVLLEII